MTRSSVGIKITARTLAVGVVGGAAFWTLGLPLAFLSGPGIVSTAMPTPLVLASSWCQAR